jgi:hypothetical protein
MLNEDTLGHLVSLHTHFAELIRDDFGLAVQSDVIEPMIAHVQQLGGLSSEANNLFRELDQMLAEARALEPVE